MINYKVERIEPIVAKNYIHEHHYTHGSHGGPSPCYGLFDGDSLIGVCMFAQPCGEKVREKVWGSENKDHVTELHRLHILDVTPRNTESWFISRVLALLKRDKPSIWGVLSFSDTTIGHDGTIYKASNAYRIGQASSRQSYVDETGRLRHQRQNGKYISIKQAIAMGWKVEHRKPKNRYLWILPDSKHHKKWLVDNCKYDIKSQRFN